MPAEILKQEALVLRVYPASNTSNVVVWWTRENGRVSTLLKGAKRPRSPYLGRFDLFQTCELLYYAHEREDLHHTKDVSPLATRHALRANWRASVVASYAADLLLRVSPPSIPHATLFDLVGRFWDGLAAHGPEATDILRFELAVLEALGLAPRLDGAGTIFSPGQGGLVAKAQAERGLPLPERAIDCLRRMQAGEDPVIGRRTWRHLREALGHFLRYHLEIPLESRTIAFNLLERYPRQKPNTAS